MTSETYEAIGRDCSILANLLENNLPSGAVSDWKGAIVASIASHFGPIPHQRCLTHIIRQAKRLLPKHSPFEATLKLRGIVKDLFLVETIHDPSVWKASLLRWEKEYGFMLKEKTIAPPHITRKWWYTHGNIRRAWRLLTHDQDPLFVFLTNPLIPKTNNSLEGINSNLKQKLGDHRGMSTVRQASFLSWYMAFTRMKTNKDLKKLWAYWKKAFLKN
jgi:transposase-like protein